MSNTSGFDGFPEECVRFFMELGQNNNKPWFVQHRGEFEDYIMTPARQFVREMGDKLRKISPDVHADPRVNKSIFRIYRDIRFSKDKTPYKTHLVLWFWEGSRPKLENSGYYFRLEPPNLMVGVGMFVFPKPLLKIYRDSVVDSEHGPALVRAIETVASKGAYDIGGKHYKRVPRGYDAEHENASLLLYNGLHVGIKTPIPEELHSEELLDYCFGIYRDMFPVHRWLLAMTERDPET